MKKYGHGYIGIEMRTPDKDYGACDSSRIEKKFKDFAEALTNIPVRFKTALA
jgi:hypothetical protein